MEKRRLPPNVWLEIQRSIPITCVDLFLTRRAANGDIDCGLIFRETPHQGRRWCLIGGRLLINESFDEGINRELRSALGDKVECIQKSALQPIFVAEYFSEHRLGRLFDPRQHAIGLVFRVEIHGDVNPGGEEALKFKWFKSSQLPNSKLFGFGQEAVVAACLSRILP